MVMKDEGIKFKDEYQLIIGDCDLFYNLKD